MKKRLVSLAVFVFLLIGLSACGASGQQPVQTAETQVEKTDKPVEESPEATVEETPKEAAEETQPLPAEQMPEEIDLAVVRDDILSTLGIEDPFLLDTDALLNLYGITPEQVKQSASFVTMAGTFPDEIILVEAVDETAAASIAEALQRRLDEVMVQSKSYDAENYAAAQACRVRTNGLFVSLILSPRHDEIAAVYEEFVL